MKLTTPLFFFIIIFTTSNISANGVFDIMNETIYTGDWGVDMDNAELTLPPDDGVWKCGRIWVLASVNQYGPNQKGQYTCSVYAHEYRGCVYKGCGKFGTTICYGEGCWVRTLMGTNFFIPEEIYNVQSNDTKHQIDEMCGGVVSDGWEPFWGDPTNPYDVSVQHGNVVWGYVEVGFRNLSKINENFCIQSEDSIHLDAGSWDEIFSDRYDKGHGWQQHRWNISDRSYYNVVGGTVTGIVDVVVDWAHMRRDGEGDTQYSNNTNKKTFGTTKVMPTVLNKTPLTSVDITSYNNSVTPYSLISVHITDNITSTEIVYKNTSSVYHHKIGFLTADEDDGEYFDFVDESVWLPDESNIVTIRGGYYVINEAPLNLSELCINVSTPYDTYEVNNYNVTTINSEPADYIQWEVMIVFLAFLGLCIASARMAVRRFRL